MISLDLAGDLKVAGLPWKPRRGDLAMDRLNDEFVVLADGVDDSGGVEIDTRGGVERRHYLMLTWIPRLDQLLAALARAGPFELAARPAGEGRRDYVWQVTLHGQDEGGRRFQASDPADAAGQALRYLLGERGWKAG